MGTLIVGGQAYGADFGDLINTFPDHNPYKDDGSFIARIDTETKEVYSATFAPSTYREPWGDFDVYDPNGFFSNFLGIADVNGRIWCANFPWEPEVMIVDGDISYPLDFDFSEHYSPPVYYNSSYDERPQLFKGNNPDVESVCFDPINDRVYIGMPDAWQASWFDAHGSHTFGSKLMIGVFDSNGNYIEDIELITDGVTLPFFSRGSDWTKISPDGNTLYFTSEDRHVWALDLFSRELNVIFSLPNEEQEFQSPIFYSFDLDPNSGNLFLLANHPYQNYYGHYPGSPPCSLDLFILAPNGDLVSSSVGFYVVPVAFDLAFGMTVDFDLKTVFFNNTNAIDDGDIKIRSFNYETQVFNPDHFPGVIDQITSLLSVSKWGSETYAYKFGAMCMSKCLPRTIASSGNTGVRVRTEDSISYVRMTNTGSVTGSSNQTQPHCVPYDPAGVGKTGVRVRSTPKGAN